MARRSALAGSLVVHGAIALVIVFARCSRPEVQLDSRQLVAIDLVTPALRVPSPSPSPSPPPVTQVGAASSPGSSPAPSRALRHAHTAAHAAASSRRTVEPAMRIESPGSQASEVRVASEAGEAREARETSEMGAAAGSGPGDGPGPGGQGGGIGFGIGGWNTSVTAAPLPVPAAPEPAKSRARPPRLIYPARDREVDDSLLFVARLTIDADGFVIGVRLVRGVGGVRDDQAANAVWRFRYSPGLDDDGRPIQVTIEQRFLVD